MRLNKKIKILEKEIALHRTGLAVGLLFVVGFGFTHTVPGRVTPKVAAAPAAIRKPDDVSVAEAPNEQKTAAAKQAAAQAAAVQAKAQAAAVAVQSKTAAQPTVSPAPPVTRASALYVNSSSNVASGARSWAAAHPADAGRMNRLAQTPMAQWFGEWSGNIQAATNGYVSAAGGQVPVLVAYNIPGRDCGSYSGGGAGGSAAYQNWINGFAAGIGQRQAVVILEPDALAGMDCLGADGQQNREQLLAFAVHALRAQTRAAVYLDAGNSNWQSAGVMAGRLKAADIAEATGFSLNVSNFYTTASNNAYGAALSGLLGGKHWVVDTSRNGNGAGGGAQAWCNPDGRAFGVSPTLQTGSAAVDAYLWIKNPGESDGNCGAAQGGSAAPAAGAWWPQYILMLANNSGW